MGRYLTVLGQSQAEYVEKRSKFIATLIHCETEEQATEFINEMRSKYWDARHNVFAYSVAGGTLSRFSDDGEPHGTAGKPVFDVITGSGVTDVAVVVTRYFGGVLLGTGGLVRAYSKAARDAVDNASFAEMIPCTVFLTLCEYTDHQRLVDLIERNGGVIENTDYTDKVALKYCFKDELVDAFLPKLSESFSARLAAVEVERKISAVLIEK